MKFKEYITEKTTSIRKFAIEFVKFEHLKDWYKIMKKWDDGNLDRNYDIKDLQKKYKEIIK